MSSIPPAALPGHQLPTAPTEFVPHPGHQQHLACPSCGSTEHLVGVYTVRTVVPIYATAVAATSSVEVEGSPDLAIADEPGNWQQPVKVACGKCQWSYEGPINPLNYLTDPE